MTKKEQLINRLKTLSDKDYLKYLMQTGWCVREIVELSIKYDWSEFDIDEDLKFLEEENIGTLISVEANEA